jgi:hypothetical protein
MAVGVEAGARTGATLAVGLSAKAGTPPGGRPGVGERVITASKVGAVRCLGRDLDVGVGVIHLREIGDLGADVVWRNETQDAPVNATTRSSRIEPKHVSSRRRVFMRLLCNVNG